VTSTHHLTLETHEKENTIAKKKSRKQMFYARNKRKKRQKCRHEQWPPQGRALPGEETTKYEPTTKTNISGRTLQHENNMHYPNVKRNTLDKEKNIFGQKNMGFARAPKFRPKTRTTP
jgi:hypothetical protein